MGQMDDLRVGIAGLGAASRLVLPAFAAVDGVRLAAGCDVREEARGAFAREYSVPVFASVEELAVSPEVDAIWIETPNHLHCKHAVAAASRGKHVIVAKPMAATPGECDRMIAAARKAGVRLLIGHSKVFDSPVRAMAEVVRSGRLGRVLQIDCLWFNDWLRRPRLAEELDEARGAGFILRQAPHLVDIAMLIAGAPAASVRAFTAQWHGTTASCGALIAFGNGAFANIALNGTGYFSTSEFTWDIGIFGEKTSRGVPSRLAAALSAEAKYAAPPRLRESGPFRPFVGVTLVQCERGLIRQSPQGLYLYTDEGREETAVPHDLGRASELIELRDALREGCDVLPNGEWGRANLDICLAILSSARQGREITLNPRL